MTSNHFFVPKSLIGDERALLRGAELHHLSRVLRARPGDEVVLFDEDGRRLQARIERLGVDEASLLILSVAPALEIRTRVILAPALLKSGAMDEVVEKAAELGAARISPVAADRSIPNIGTDPGRKQARWERIALEASKQSRSGRPPAIDRPVPLASFLETCRADRKLVLSERGGRPLKDAAADGPPAEAAALVGPEGGWTDGEIEAAVRAGFEPVSLGRTVLRAETAALSVLAVLGHLWNG